MSDDGVRQDRFFLSVGWSFRRQILRLFVMKFQSENAKCIMKGCGTRQRDSAANKLTGKSQDRKAHIVLSNLTSGQKITLLYVYSSAGLRTNKWSNISIPNTVLFGRPWLRNTTVTFSLSDSYDLRSTFTDGTVSTSDNDITTVAARRPCNGRISRIPAVVANASDGVALIGIQVKLDDTNMWCEPTSTLYSSNTTMSSDGCYTVGTIAVREI